MTEAKDRIEAMKDWSEKSERLANNIKDLQELKKAVKSVKKLGKIAGAFGVAGVGIDIVLSFMNNGPSPEEQILEAVGDLSSKVDGLWNSMDNHFEDLTFQNDWNTAKLQITPAVTQANQMRELLNNYKANRNKNDLYTLRQFEEQFRKHFDEVTIGGMLRTIAEQASGKGLRTDLFETAYNHSNGNIATVSAVGLELIHLFSTGLMGLGIWHRLDWEEHNPGKEMPPERETSIKNRIQDAHEKDFKAVIHKFEEFTEKCIKELPKMVKKIIEGTLNKKCEIRDSRYIHETYRMASKVLCKELAHRWAGFDWLVITGIGGLTNEKVAVPESRQSTDSGYGSHFDLHFTHKSGEICYFVAWRPKGDGAWNRSSFTHYVDTQITGHGLNEIRLPRFLNQPIGQGTPCAFLTGMNIAWSPYWTNAKRIGLLSYHSEWLTPEQYNQMKTWQYPHKEECSYLLFV